MMLPAYGPPDGAADLRAFAQGAAQAFAIPPAHADVWLELLPPEAFRLWREQSVVRGGLVLYRMGQHFGGKRVDACGIAAVHVHPEQRGHGIATRLMREALLEMHTAGVAVSPLYSASNTLYGSLGWANAGARSRYTISGSAITTPRGSKVQLEPVAGPDDARVPAAYARVAPRLNGWLDRPEALWKHLMSSAPEQPLYGAVCEGGYLLYTTARGPEDFHHRLTVRDFAWADADTGRALAAYLAGQSTQAEHVTLWCTDDEPMLEWLVPAADLPVTSRQYQMLRIVNADIALQQRGWPPGFDGELKFTLIDPVLEAESGPRRLSIRAGKAEVTRETAASGPNLDVRGLSMLYGCLRTPYDLRRLGLLTGDDSGDADLTAAFAGARAGTPEFF
jgi:predicted acetyltransferase